MFWHFMSRLWWFGSARQNQRRSNRKMGYKKMTDCDKCGLDHTGPCQDAIRKHYEGRIAELKRALVKHGRHDAICPQANVFSNNPAGGQTIVDLAAFEADCTCGIGKALKE